MCFTDTGWDFWSYDSQIPRHPGENLEKKTYLDEKYDHSNKGLSLKVVIWHLP